MNSGIVKGYIYRFKYRVLNQIGWSGFSDTTYILAANVPSRPSTPSYLFSNSSQIFLIILLLYEPSDNGGSLVTSY